MHKDMAFHSLGRHPDYSQWPRVFSYRHPRRFGPRPAAKDHRPHNRQSEHLRNSGHCRAARQCWPFAAPWKAWPSVRAASDPDFSVTKCCRYCSSCPGTGSSDDPLRKSVIHSQCVPSWGLLCPQICAALIQGWPARTWTNTRYRGPQENHHLGNSRCSPFSTLLLTVQLAQSPPGLTTAMAIWEAG